LSLFDPAAGTRIHTVRVVHRRIQGLCSPLSIDTAYLTLVNFLQHSLYSEGGSVFL